MRHVAARNDSGDPGTVADWIFGYGSLIWRPGFPYAEARPAVVRGWRRRFWQGSTDHRGVPGAPGRVVTLVADATATCLGRAYRLVPGGRESLLAVLDRREQGGYVRTRLTVEFAGGGQAAALTWLAPADNVDYLGPADLPALAAQVHAAAGPSGSNVEYVLELAAALRRLGAAHDEETFALEAALHGMQI
ncbi:MAG: gamma-glutamylcyclotransferase [Gammaproteobacteria bacterium]|nr:gamma-glutamylcyclotransferase [Gammaproteobacteria bacterium]